VPLYEYQCESCGKPTDIRHGFNEAVDQTCPACGGALKRVFSAAGIVFKGSGFYVNDSRPKKSESASGSSGSSSTSAGAASGGAGSESKPSSESKPAESATSSESKSPPKDGGSPGKSEAAA